MTKKQKWFKREILERFMSEKELEQFQDEYENHSIRKLGKILLQSAARRV